VRLRRYLKPSVLLRRKALRSGVFGGDRRWLTVFLTMFAWRKVKSLFGFGEPQPVFVREAVPGDVMVVAHEEDKTTRRKRRKEARKQTKKAAKAERKDARKRTKKAAKARRKADRAADRAARRSDDLAAEAVADRESISV